MSELGPETRALLDAARSGDEPTPEDHARVKRRVWAQIGVAVGAAAGASAGAAASNAGATGAKAVAASAARAWLTWKGLAVVAVAAGVGAGAYALARAWSAPPQSSGVVQIASPTAAGSTVPAATPPADSASATPADSTPVVDVGQLPVAAPPSASGAAAAPASSGSLQDELALIRAADAALRAGNPARALALTDEHARRFPRGALSEERAGMRILALCAMGNASSSGAAAFLASHAGSPLAPRIRTACGL